MPATWRLTCAYRGASLHANDPVLCGEAKVGGERVVSVRQAITAAELDHARALFRAFVAWHRDRHAEDLDLIDRYFDPTGFERELAGLPGPYAPPSGRLLLAEIGGAVAGCAVLQRIDDQSCEIKRMFVSPATRRCGAGRALATGLIRAARDEAYTAMYLDTSIGQGEALSLYRSLGFAEVEPYYDTPQPLRDWLVFMRLAL
jgi:GNAT superfamily N-acetyltransferase